MFYSSKLILLGIALASFIGSIPSQAMKRLEVDFEYVSKQAKKLSVRIYKPSGKQTPEVLQKLDFDDYRKIRIVPENTFWRNEGMPFQVQFYHLGYLYNEPITFNEFTRTHVQRIPYMPNFFDLRNLDFNRSFSSSLDYAGFKLLYPLNNQNVPYDELISFLGASYFRALGKGMHYGISARGLAVNSGLADPEEFPRFIEFWLGKPKGNSTSFLIYALMDSLSVSGAYQFRIFPNGTTRIEVKTRLFVRKEMKSIGFAPLTSMFWHGENGPENSNDYRPECHDSDGLLIEMEDGRLWRPLDTHEQTRLSYFRADSPVGFGLFQRDREFGHYQDLSAEYHERPSVWVKPKGDWGEGHVRLVELPANREFDDNVVTFWEPNTKPQPGESLNLEYTLFWTKQMALTKESVPMPVSTRIGDHLSELGVKVFVIEFAAKEGVLYWDAAPEEFVQVSGNAFLSYASVERNKFENTWRATLNVKLNEGQKGPVELSCRLDFDGEIESETWTYQWLP